MKGIADTGFLVAFANRADDHHAWAIGVAARVTEPLLTCEAVLAEAAFHLRSASLVFAMLQDGRSRSSCGARSLRLTNVRLLPARLPYRSANSKQPICLSKPIAFRR